MIIQAVSDMHGTLPDVPACDLLLIAGDICPIEDHDVHFQSQWLNTTFRAWLGQLHARHVVGVCGNHDFVFEKRPDLVPTDLPWTYLQDSACEVEGLKVWGTPWQPWFHDWAFNLYEPDLVAKWRLIPEGTDVLVLHGPPYGLGDAVPRGGGTVENTGSPSLLARIKEVQPLVAVYGHIHEGRGQYRVGRTVLANVTILDEKYRHVYPVWRYDLERGG